MNLATPSTEQIRQWREHLKHARQDLLDQSTHGHVPIPRLETVLKRYAEQIDLLLQRIWHGLDMASFADLCATGGYGRRELFPFSDIDVMTLTKRIPTAEDEEKIALFLSIGWDIGLELGHSLRLHEEALAEAANDITIQTALLESRLVAGDPASMHKLHQALRQELKIDQFFQGKMLELRQRHANFQEAAYALEPNIKESPGGLRDLHVILWVVRAAGLGETWSDLTQHGLITHEEAQQLQQHERRLKSLRLHLHRLVGRREDRLIFDIQTSLAQHLGLHDTPEKRASEQLMMRYYRSANTVLQLSAILLQNLELALITPKRTTNIEIIDGVFQKSDGVLSLRPAATGTFSQHPEALLRAFLVMQQHADIKTMSPPLLRAIWHYRGLIDSDYRKNALHKKMFIEFFQSQGAIVQALRLMNQTGVLGRYLPVFGRIVGQMQHDLFHVYTVDQHILMVIRNLRRFTMTDHSHEYPLCSELMGEFGRPWVLYLAALFHDIAKGRGGDHSDLGAKDAMRFCKAHGVNKQDSELIVFLVKHHLLMSTVAQKQDLADPNVIQHFASIVGNQNRLVALYLLTVADIRGTSPKVWNAWKSKLLEDLFYLTRQQLLTGHEDLSRLTHSHRQTACIDMLQAKGMAVSTIEAFWSRLRPSYFMRTPPEDIIWHTETIAKLSDPCETVVDIQPGLTEGTWKFLIFCPDQPDLFARICQYFFQQQLNVLDAKIYTSQAIKIQPAGENREDLLAFAIDTFVVSSHHDLQGDFEHIKQTLRASLNNPQPLVMPQPGRIPRQAKHLPITPTVDMQLDDQQQHFIIHASATDRPGLLYQLAYVFAQHHANLLAAKVTTLGARAEDSFLISAQNFINPKTQLALETSLLKVLS